MKEISGTLSSIALELARIKAGLDKNGYQKPRLKRSARSCNAASSTDYPARTYLSLERSCCHPPDRIHLRQGA
jgi:hypothetical protein